MSALTPKDEEHLNLLTIFHYVVAAMQALFASTPIFHFLIGAFLLFGPGSGHGAERVPAAFMGGIFMGFAGAWMLIGWTVAICVAVAGTNLARRKHYMFCIITAAVIAAICMPFGTALGIFTIIVLQRPQVKEAFS